MSIKFGYTYEKIVLSALLMASVLLSVLISSNKSIWRDEGFSYLLAQQSVGNIITTSAKDFTPPLYYLLLHPLIKLVGPNETVLRLLSLLPIVSLQLLLAKEIRKYFPGKNQLLASLLMLMLFTQPLMLYFSVELRVYSLTMLLTYLVFSSLARGLDTKANTSMYITAQVALLYAHNLGIFFWLMQLVALTSFWITQKNWQKLLVFLSANALVLVLYLPWIPILFSQVSARSTETWLTFDPVESAKTIQNLFVFNELSAKLPDYYTYFARLNVLLATLGFVGSLGFIAKKFFSLKLDQEATFMAKKTRLAFVLAGLTFGTLYAYSWLSQPILYGRYIAFLFPLGFVCTLFGWKLLSTRLYSLTIVLVLLYASTQFFVVSHLVHATEKTNYAQIKRYKDMPAYSDSDLDIMPCMFYHPDCVYVGETSASPIYIGVKQLETITEVSDWTKVSQTRAIIIRRNQNKLPEALQSSYVPEFTLDLGEGVNLTQIAKVTN
jgi:4-amino-4-deoxy-L-arabinose transferase-like glycosyltransferase